MPLFLALSLVAGILIGTFYANHFSGNRLSIINTGSNKLNDLLRIIDEQYVDTVNVKDLVESAMPKILSELDPHSAYIKKVRGFSVKNTRKNSTVSSFYSFLNML